MNRPTSIYMKKKNHQTNCSGAGNHPRVKNKSERPWVLLIVCGIMCVQDRGGEEEKKKMKILSKWTLGSMSVSLKWYQDTYPLDIHPPDIHPLPFTP